MTEEIIDVGIGTISKDKNKTEGDVFLNSSEAKYFVDVLRWTGNDELNEKIDELDTNGILHLKFYNSNHQYHVGLVDAHGNSVDITDTGIDIGDYLNTMGLPVKFSNHQEGNSSEDSKKGFWERHPKLKKLAAAIAIGLIGLGNISVGHHDTVFSLKDLSNHEEKVKYLEKIDSFIPFNISSLNFVDVDNGSSIRIERNLFNDAVDPYASTIHLSYPKEKTEELKEYLDSHHIKFKQIGERIRRNKSFGEILLRYSDVEANINEILKIAEIDRNVLKYLDIKSQRPDYDIVSYKEFMDYLNFHFPNSPNSNHKQNKHKTDYSKELEILTKEFNQGQISCSEYFDKISKLNEEMVEEYVNSTLRNVNVGIVNGKIVVVNDDNTIPRYDISEDFKERFLEDMSKIGYFKYENGRFVPTKKFNRSLVIPQKILEDMFRVVEKRMDYDYIKMIFDGKGSYKYGDETYKIGKGVCHDYAIITRDAWRILQSYSPELRKIDIFYVSSDPMNHAWNGIKFENKITYVDLTWDDVDGKPIEESTKTDISAVDSYHFVD